MPKCYMCDADATTREHDPPISFFPPENRIGVNLIVVPSCVAHNLDNSNDVEIVRNQIALYMDGNAAAQSLALGKVFRAFKRSIAVTKRTLKNLRPITVAGQQTGIFECDRNALENVMSAIANAEYYRSKGLSHDGDWEIFPASLVLESTLATGNPDSFAAAREMAAKFPFSDVTTADPTIFKCGVFEDGDQRIIYRFQFYEGFIVYAWSKPRCLNRNKARPIR